MNGFLDLLSIFFVGKFGKRPMHFFGTMGTLSFLTGFIMAGWVSIEKLYLIAHGQHYRDITDNPLFYIAIVAIILGSQLFLTGFVAELISRNSSDRNHYQIEDSI